jgi:4-carboxymuconolactone decarboxylase
MDTADLAAKGLKLRKELFGDQAVEQRMNAFGAFGEPLQHIINAYAYGDVWSRPGLSLGVKSLAMIAMMAAANRPAELRVHLKGALKNGCTPDEVREILLLVALYCGIPAANEAHRAAMDVLARRRSSAARDPPPSAYPRGFTNASCSFLNQTNPDASTFGTPT